MKIGQDKNSSTLKVIHHYISCRGVSPRHLGDIHHGRI